MNSYTSNAELKAIVKKIRQMYKELGGSVASEESGNSQPTRPSSKVEEVTESDVSGECSIQTVDQFIALVDAMATKMVEFFDGYFDAFTAQYGPLSEQSSPEIQQRFQMGMMKLAEE